MVTHHDSVELHLDDRALIRAHVFDILASVDICAFLTRLQCVELSERFGGQY